MLRMPLSPETEQAAATFDAGHMGCGELVMLLRLKLKDMPGKCGARDRPRFRCARGSSGLVPDDPQRTGAARSADAQLLDPLADRLDLTPREPKDARKIRRLISCAKNDTDKATVGFVIANRANAAVASDKETVVFLSIEGTRLSQQGYADDIHERALPR